MNLISREAVLAILGEFERRTKTCLPIAEVERLPYLVAPNPLWEHDRNALGQTEPEFWGIVDSQPASAASDPKPRQVP